MALAAIDRRAVPGGIPSLEDAPGTGDRRQVSVFVLPQLLLAAGRRRDRSRGAGRRGRHGIHPPGTRAEGVDGQGVLGGTDRGAHAGRIVRRRAVRHARRRRHRDHGDDRRAGSRCVQRGDRIDQGLAHRQVAGGIQRPGSAGRAAAGRARRAAGPAGRGGIGHAAQRGLTDERAGDVDRAVVGHRHFVRDGSAGEVGRHVAVADRDAQVHQDRRAGGDAGLHQRPDERAHGVGADVVVAIVDDRTAARGRGVGRYGEGDREAAAGAVHQVAHRTIDVVRPRRDAIVDAGAGVRVAAGDERQVLAVRGDRRGQAHHRAQRVDATVVDVVVGIGDLFAGLGGGRPRRGHAQARHLRAEHVHVDLCRVIGGAWLAVGDEHLQHHHVTGVQPAIAGGDVEALPVGGAVAADPGPRDAGLSGEVERLEELGVALGLVDHFHEEERLFHRAVPGVVEHRRHREADMHLAIDGIDVGQRHRGLLLDRGRLPRLPVIATDQGRCGSRERELQDAIGVGRGAGRGEDLRAVTAAVAAGRRRPGGHQPQLRGGGRRIRGQDARAVVVAQRPVGKALGLETAVLDLRLRRGRHRQQGEQAQRRQCRADARPPAHEAGAPALQPLAHGRCGVDGGMS